MDYKEILKDHSLNISKLRYELAGKLLSLLNDNDIVELYSKNNELFGTLSGKSTADLIENYQKDILEAINVITDFLWHKERETKMTDDKYNKLSIEEVKQYIINNIIELLNSKSEEILDWIKVGETLVSK